MAASILAQKRILRKLDPNNALKRIPRLTSEAQVNEASPKTPMAEVKPGRFLKGSKLGAYISRVAKKATNERGGHCRRSPPKTIIHLLR
jgi:hypothetical protein